MNRIYHSETTHHLDYYAKHSIYALLKDRVFLFDFKIYFCIFIKSNASDITI